MTRRTLALAAFVSTDAHAQDYRFPTSQADFAEFYPTAYRDDGDLTDWSCASYTYAGHRGSDFGVGSWAGMDAGRDVVAAAEGVVISATDGADDRCTTGTCDGGDGGYCGNSVSLRHPDGRSTVYCHMKRGSVRVSVGDVVACGDALGLVGSSGWSTGPHLHFGTFDEEGVNYDPFAGPCGAEQTAWVEQGEYDGVPGITCDDPVDPCEVYATLTCGDRWQGSNGGPGSTDLHAWYQCTQGLETGPERMFSVVTALDEEVIVRVTGMTGDLDVFLLPDETCDGHPCLAKSIESGTTDETLRFNAEAGRVNHVLVDGYVGVVSDFVVEVECAGRVEPEVTDEPTTSRDTATAGSAVVPATPRPCGCDGAGPSAWWFGALAGAIQARRRAARPRAVTERRGTR